MYLLNVYLFLFADLMHCKHLCVVTGIDAQAYSYVMLMVCSSILGCETSESKVEDLQAFLRHFSKALPLFVFLLTFGNLRVDREQ